eukprot:comp23749_c0_seq1/m.41023 comp23749_c0_seq1/g.41023  ORF comp23749_c0_seq1/g.41023 comp23749_c0_seq1/m.41023 type:complete len:667 (-) comp23749_c0_seq1:2-2002(-)
MGEETTTQPTAASTTETKQQNAAPGGRSAPKLLPAPDFGSMMKMAAPMNPMMGPVNGFMGNGMGGMGGMGGMNTGGMNGMGGMGGMNGMGGMGPGLGPGLGPGMAMGMGMGMGMGGMNGMGGGMYSPMMQQGNMAMGQNFSGNFGPSMGGPMGGMQGRMMGPGGMNPMMNGGGMNMHGDMAMKMNGQMPGPGMYGNMQGQGCGDAQCACGGHGNMGMGGGQMGMMNTMNGMGPNMNGMMGGMPMGGNFMGGPMMPGPMPMGGSMGMGGPRPMMMGPRGMIRPPMGPMSSRTPPLNAMSPMISSNNLNTSAMPTPSTKKLATSPAAAASTHDNKKDMTPPPQPSSEEEMKPETVLEAVQSTNLNEATNLVEQHFQMWSRRNSTSDTKASPKMRRLRQVRSSPMNLSPIAPRSRSGSESAGSKLKPHASENTEPSVKTEAKYLQPLPGLSRRPAHSDHSNQHTPDMESASTMHTPAADHAIDHDATPQLANMQSWMTSTSTFSTPTFNNSQTPAFETHEEGNMGQLGLEPANSLLLDSAGFSLDDNSQSIQSIMASLMLSMSEESDVQIESSESAFDSMLSQPVFSTSNNPPGGLNSLSCTDVFGNMHLYENNQGGFKPLGTGLQNFKLESMSAPGNLNGYGQYEDNQSGSKNSLPQPLSPLMSLEPL